MQNLNSFCKMNYQGSLKYFHFCKTKLEKTSIISEWKNIQFFGFYIVPPFFLLPHLQQGISQNIFLGQMSIKYEIENRSQQLLSGKVMAQWNNTSNDFHNIMYCIKDYFPGGNDFRLLGHFTCILVKQQSCQLVICSWQLMACHFRHAVTHFIEMHAKNSSISSSQSMGKQQNAVICQWVL